MEGGKGKVQQGGSRANDDGGDGEEGIGISGDWKSWGSTSGGGARVGAGLWFVRFLRYQVGLKLI